MYKTIQIKIMSLSIPFLFGSIDSQKSENKFWIRLLRRTIFFLLHYFDWLNFFFAEVRVKVTESFILIKVFIVQSLSDDNNPGEYSESSIPILEPQQSNEELETQVDLETQDDLEDQDQQNNAKDPDSIEFETSEHNSGIGDHGLTIVKLPDDNEDNDEDYDDDDIGDNDDDDDDYYGEPEYVLVIDERIRKPGGGGKNRRGNKNNERNRQKSSTRCNRRSKSCSVDMFVLGW